MCLIRVRSKLCRNGPDLRIPGPAYITFLAIATLRSHSTFPVLVSSSSHFVLPCCLFPDLLPVYLGLTLCLLFRTLFAPGAVDSHVTAPGEQLGVQCLAQGHLSRGIEGRENTGYSLPPPTIPAGPEIRTHNLWITSPTL